MVEMASSNTLTMISAMLHGVVEQHMSRFVARAAASASAETHSRKSLAGIRSFEKLAKLIEARDGSAAEAHWRAHLKNANAAWLLGYDQTSLVDVLE
jgi:GntR family transcriptional repressor for pyruvate dehydrogenase complex